MARVKRGADERSEGARLRAERDKRGMNKGDMIWLE